jgi:hypothetical protein
VTFAAEFRRFVGWNLAAIVIDIDIAVFRVMAIQAVIVGSVIQNEVGMLSNQNGGRFLIDGIMAFTAFIGEAGSVQSKRAEFATER